MKAAVYHGPLAVRVKEVAEPGPPGPDEVLLAPLLGSLCGTDVTEFLVGPKRIPLHQAHPVSGHQGPVILGHEFVGIVLAVGAAVTGLHVGQRVVPGAGMWCGTCPPCQSGRTNICERAVLYGIHTHGGLAEQVKVPASMCVAVPESCSNEAAALAQPCAVAMHALGRVSIEPGQSVALFGLGGIGSFLLAALLARTEGDLSLIVVEVGERKRDLTERLGAFASTFIKADQFTETEILELTGGRGVDLAIEASGSPTAIQQALSAIRSGGTLLQVGIPTGRVSLPLGRVVPREVSIVTTNGMICEVDLPRALALLSQTDLATQITDRIIPLDALVAEGLEPLALHEVLGKVLVRIQEVQSRIPTHRKVERTHANPGGKPTNLSVSHPDKGGRDSSHCLRLPD
ncbi:MAG TPA: alcohol dehydrogenase catalytic domain-containing protein [Ktedonobacteraceae bacterium]|nr:alcohol dehydrogenase catalytic domain-containing protein [Ktedonobacteraceae bacterium]